MKLTKQSNYVGFDISKQEDFVKGVNADLENIYTAFAGRLRFGRGTDGDRGENIQGRFQQFTSHATPDTEFTVAHGLGAIPVGRIILWQDIAGILYQSPTNGTDWDTTNAYFKCTVASVTFLVFFIQ